MGNKPNSTDHGAEYFLVLPDCDSASAVVSARQFNATRTIAYESGRPWIVGNWIDDNLIISRIGDIKIALIGCCSATASEYLGKLKGTNDIEYLDSLGTSVAGSFHLVASRGGVMRVQGTVSGLRRIFYTCINGVTIAADRADALAFLRGAAINDLQLAVRLLEPEALHPLGSEPLWEGVYAVLPGHYLRLGHEGYRRLIKWWDPPLSTLSLEEGAYRLKDALVTAVKARTDRSRGISCDLSGGLDSTSICWLAAPERSDLIAYTSAAYDRADDDMKWATVTARKLPGMSREILPRPEVPFVFEGVSTARDALDEPNNIIVDRAKLLKGLQRLSARGSELHLTGLGGDQLLVGWPGHLHSILRTRPALAFKQLRGCQALFGWAPGEMIKMLKDHRSYGQWLFDSARHITEPMPPPRYPLLDWSFVRRIPPWITKEVGETVRNMIQEAARDVSPLGTTRGSHAEVEIIQLGGKFGRIYGQMAEPLGLTLASPFLDDQVIEACLSVAPEERISAWEYKPLIKKAMQCIVPDEVLERTTKAEGSAEEEAGIHLYRGELAELFCNSALGERGIVDDSKLRAALSGNFPSSFGPGNIYNTVACEVWLRSLNCNRRIFGRE